MHGFKSITDKLLRVTRSCIDVTSPRATAESQRAPPCQLLTLYLPGLEKLGVRGEGLVGEKKWS